MSSEINFLYLNEKDMIKAGVANMEKCLSTMEEMFLLLDKGDYRMGGEDANEHGIRVTFPTETLISGMPIHKPDYRFMAMPAYLGGEFHMFGIKSYGSNPDNVKKRLPRSILMMSLMDVNTGAPIAYMSANILSAMRTGGVCGVGAKYLCKEKPKTVAVIGPGTMSRYAMKAFIELYPELKTIKIKGRGEENIRKFIKSCERDYPQIRHYSVCNSIPEACQNADIIFFGTTNSANYKDNPSIQYEWVKKGAVVISTSALRVDMELLAKEDVKLVADSFEMYENWGRGQEFPTQKNVSTLLGMGFYDAVCQGKISREKIIDIGEIVGGKKRAREKEEDIIIYAVGGMPIEDVAWGVECYQNAERNGIGTKLNLWTQPEM